MPEVLLMVLTVYGLNKADKRISVPASAMLVLWTIAAVVLDGGRSHYYHGAWFRSDSIYSAIFLWAGIYCRLLPPVLLLICALKPSCIHNSVKVLSGYMAVVLMLFIAGDLLKLFADGHASMEHLSVTFLLNACLPPLMLIFGLNAVLMFPIPFSELAKIFGKTLLIVGFIAMVSAAQQADQQARERAEEQRQEHLEEMRDNILSWEKAGFGENFSMEAAKDMLQEGRITYDEY